MEYADAPAFSLADASVTHHTDTRARGFDASGETGSPEGVETPLDAPLDEAPETGPKGGARAARDPLLRTVANNSGSSTPSEPDLAASDCGILGLE